MSCSNLYRILLKIEKLMTELWGQCKFFYAIASLLAQVIYNLHIYIVRWNILIGSPTVVNYINQFFCNIFTETIIPPIIKPLTKFFSFVNVCKLSIQFSLFSQ